MTTQWTKWFLLFIEANKVNTANLLAAQWDPDDGSTTFGSVKLSPTGEEPITHYACSTPATETMRDGITTALGALSWAYMYWTDEVYHDEGGDGAHWVGPDGLTFEGGIYEAWLAALEDMGLQRIQMEDVFAADAANLAEAADAGALGASAPRARGRLRDALGRFVKG